MRQDLELEDASADSFFSHQKSLSQTRDVTRMAHNDTLVIIPCPKTSDEKISSCEPEPKLRLSNPVKAWLKRPSGYQPKNEFLYRAWNIFLSLAILPFIFPVMIAIAALLALSQGSHILYKGPRLGKGRKEFDIYKFRTLTLDAADATKNSLLTTRTNLETRFGGVLRHTRLDELPQIFNILIGDMNFMGPRPVRQAISDKISKEISDYESRFLVKPGLVGYSQSLLPHSAPKKMRHRLNAKLVHKKVSLIKEVFFLFRNSLSILGKTFRVLCERIFNLKRPMKNRRKNYRVKANNLEANIIGTDGVVAKAELVDINDEAFAIRTDRFLDKGDYKFSLAHQRNFNRRFHFQGNISHRLKTQSPGKTRIVKKEGKDNTYLVFFNEKSPMQNYRLERYILKTSVVS